jgi:hypothetical protein
MRIYKVYSTPDKYLADQIKVDKNRCRIKMHDRKM